MIGYNPEFYSNLLTNTLNGQRQLDGMAQWVNQGLKVFEDLTAMFRKVNGLEQTGVGSPDYFWVWKKAQDEFKRSFKDYLNLLGVVTRNEYLLLLGRYEETKEKAASHEETIKQLRQLLFEAKNTSHLEAAQQFDDLLKKQNEQFQKLLENLSEAFHKNTQPVEAKENCEA